MNKKIQKTKINPFDQFKKRNHNLPQGYNKFIEYIEELRRNTHFKKDFERLIRFFKENKNTKKREKKAFIFCKKYSIPIGTLEGLGYIKDGERFFWGWVVGQEFNYDMCLPLHLSAFINKKYKYFLNIFKNRDLIQKSIINCFPVAIAIHKLSTKRDLLDYINKEWRWIEGLLSHYRKKPYIGREKKIDWEITDFIWENRNSPVKKIKERLDKRFPNKKLIYNEIIKFKNLEKKRRMKNSVVQ